MAINPPSSILIIGGTGFIGCQLTARLVSAGYKVTLPTRHREKVREHLTILPGVTVIDANVHNAATLSNLMPGHDAVIFLVGILQGNAAKFTATHVNLAAKVMEAAVSAGIKRYLHMSALGASVDGPSLYLRSKGEAEQKVYQSGLDWTIFRPSIVFGENDSFLNLFARMLSISPVLPLAKPGARFQPVWVDDVARAFEYALTYDALIGESINLVGPTIYRFDDLVRYVGHLTGHPRLIIGLPDTLSTFQAMVMELLFKNPPLSRDNLASLSVDSTDPAGFTPILPWKPGAVEVLAPLWLANRRARGRYLGYRKQH